MSVPSNVSLNSYLRIWTMCFFTAVLFVILLPKASSQSSSTLVYSEAPALAQAVREGKLPPVKERMPEQPAVITPLHQIGKYGGTWRMLASNVGDMQLNLRMGYEPLVRWDPTGRKVIPGVAESWEMLEDGKVFQFKLRKGMRWSDGDPFTSADFIFTNESILRNEDLTLISLPHLRINNQLPIVEAPDAHTVIFRFVAPYGGFLKALAFQGMQRDLFLPSHYIKKHHPQFIPEAELKAKMAVGGFTHWSDYFMFVSDLDKNKDLPTLSAFKIEIPYPAALCVAERNPYYWKVDTEGNQLPYIDKLAYTMTFDLTVLNLKAMNGEVDFQQRRIDASNFTLFSEQGLQKGYQVRRNPSTNPTCVYLNQHSRNEKLRPILQDRRFRQALSHAVNREELVELIYSGLAIPSNGFAIPEDVYFIDGLGNENITYDVEKSNKLLDEMGMKRGEDGMRTYPDGTRFTQLLNILPSEEGNNPDLYQLLSEYWREIGLNFVIKQDESTLAFLQATSGNSDFLIYLNAGLHWDIDATWKIPLSNLSYLSPVNGAHYQTEGRRGAAPLPDLKRLLDWYLELRSTPNDDRRMELGHNILKQWSDECYVVGICRAPVVAIVSNRFKNLPEKINYDYRLKSPGYLGIEQFYIDEGGSGN